MKFSQKMCEWPLRWILLTLLIIGFVRWHFSSLEDFLVKDKTPYPVPRADQSRKSNPAKLSNFSIIPDKYLANVPWKVKIVKAPRCPNVRKMYFIKTSPLNFELRRLSRLMKGFDTIMFN